MVKELYLIFCDKCEKPLNEEWGFATMPLHIQAQLARLGGWMIRTEGKDLCPKCAKRLLKQRARELSSKPVDQILYGGLRS